MIAPAADDCQRLLGRGAASLRYNYKSVCRSDRNARVVGDEP
jgi:hypothetical protein